MEREIVDGENESIVNFVTEECSISGCIADSDGGGSKINLEGKFNSSAEIQVTFIMFIQDLMVVEYDLFSGVQHSVIQHDFTCH
jgi:hypothetical protein